MSTPLTEQAEPPAAGRAGRNLPVALAVGLGLGAVVLITLYAFKPAFLVVVIVAILTGLWELVSALKDKGMSAPLVPIAAGGVAMLILAYTDGREAMTVALVLTVVAVVVWRAAEGAQGMLLDIGAGLLSLVYVPFLAGFAALMLAPHDGARRVTAFIATVVASDVGGYALGVLAGKHPMAPTVSPKKSWEGFAGSAVACAACGSILFVTLLHAHWWQGVVFGLATVCTATLGDLCESVIKRDLGIKDMSHVIPGHGGLMDRLDSLLATIAPGWLLLPYLVF